MENVRLSVDFHRMLWKSSRSLIYLMSAGFGCSYDSSVVSFGNPLRIFRFPPFLIQLVLYIVHVHRHVNCRRSYIYIYVANIDQATERISLNTDIVVKGLGEFILSAFTTINQNSMKTILQYSLIVCSYRQHPYMSIVLPAGQNSS